MSTNLSDKLKKYKVSIFGEEYSIISDEPENFIIYAAQIVDNCMREIVKKSKETPPKRVAVLVALQLASKTLMAKEELNSCQEESDKIINIIDENLNQINKVNSNLAQDQ